MNGMGSNELIRILLTYYVGFDARRLSESVEYNVVYDQMSMMVSKIENEN